MLQGDISMDATAKKSEKTYERVINYVKDEIWRGNLKRGERLPSERDLAELLGVSRNSVREAMRTLSLMGFISSIHGGGNFISWRYKLFAFHHRKDAPSEFHGISLFLLL